MANAYIFKSPEELKIKIQQYFNQCDIAINAYTKEGEPILGKPYLITGVALALGTTRKTLLDYEKLEEKENFYDKEKAKEFRKVIEWAKTCCENYAESRLFVGQNTSGAIFALKNYDWTDKVDDEGKQDRDIHIHLNKSGD